MSVTAAGKLNSLAPKAENGLKRGLILSGKLVAQRATNKAPRLTGRLKRSIAESAPYAVGRGAWGVNVGTNVEYARAHEEGSGIYALNPAHRELIEIKAKNKRALAFSWPNAPAEIKPSKKTGLYVFLRVFHSGIRPTPYLRPAIDESRNDIRRLIAVNVAGAIRGQ